MSIRRCGPVLAASRAMVIDGVDVEALETTERPARFGRWLYREAPPSNTVRQVVVEALHWPAPDGCRLSKARLRQTRATPQVKHGNGYSFLFSGQRRFFPAAKRNPRRASRECRESKTLTDSAAGRVNTKTTGPDRTSILYFASGLPNMLG